MRKLLNKPWFVALLAIAAIAAVWSSLAPAVKTPRPATNVPAEPEPASAATEPTTNSEAQSAPSPDTLKQLPPAKPTRDPFAVSKPAQSAKPADERVSDEPDLIDTVHLTALWTQDGATLIYLNDHIQHVGDTIGRLTIDSATPQGIWLSHAKGKTFLETGKTFTLKTPARQAVKKNSP